MKWSYPSPSRFGTQRSLLLPNSMSHCDARRGEQKAYRDYDELS